MKIKKLIILLSLSMVISFIFTMPAFSEESKENQLIPPSNSENLLDSRLVNEENTVPTRDNLEITVEPSSVTTRLVPITNSDPGTITPQGSVIGDYGSAALDFLDARPYGFSAYWTLISTVGPIEGYNLYLTLSDGQVYPDTGVTFKTSVSGMFEIGVMEKGTYRGTLSGTVQTLLGPAKILPATASITIR